MSDLEHLLELITSTMLSPHLSSLTNPLPLCLEEFVNCL